jgi:hypothetical protein
MDQITITKTSPAATDITVTYEREDGSQVVIHQGTPLPDGMRADRGTAITLAAQTLFDLLGA